MGGIMRDREQDCITSRPIAPWPEETGGRERMTAGFLRITAGAPAAEAKDSGTTPG
jgi:hypothetical protein